MFPATELSISTIKSHLDQITILGLAEGSRSLYACAVVQFDEFVEKWGLFYQTFDHQLMLFILYLSSCDRAPSTIITYISVIKSQKKLLGICLENEFLLTRLIKGVKKFKHRIHRHRQAISTQLLYQMLCGIHKLNLPALWKTTFAVMAVTCFFGLLHLGEVMQSLHNIKADDVHFYV